MIIAYDFKDILYNALKDINCEKVLLFGSRARDEANSDSDYDLLIILKDKSDMRTKIKISTLIRKKLAQKLIDADVIVKNSEEIEYYKNKIGSVVMSALSEGIIL